MAIADALVSLVNVLVLPGGGAGEPITLVKSSRDLPKMYEVALPTASALGRGNALSSEVLKANPFLDTEVHDIKALSNADKGGTLGSK